jgi:hypothetical protein
VKAVIAYIKVLSQDLLGYSDEKNPSGYCNSRPRPRVQSKTEAVTTHDAMFGQLVLRYESNEAT